jgi:hypothetical protein
MRGESRDKKRGNRKCKTLFFFSFFFSCTYLFFLLFFFFLQDSSSLLLRMRAIASLGEINFFENCSFCLIETYPKVGSAVSRFASSKSLFFFSLIMARRCSGSLYQLLELTPQCSADDVKKAYRRIALKIHPDKTGGATTIQFQRVKHAHDTLLDPQQRKMYDTFGSRGMQQMQNMGLPPGVPVALRNLSVMMFFASLLLLIQLSLVVVKVDKGKDWSWQHVLAPLWIMLSLAFLGIVCTIGVGLKDLTVIQVFPLASLLFFLIGVSIGGHAVCAANDIDEWRAAFWAGFFPFLLTLGCTTLLSLSLSNVKTFLSISPEYRYKLDVIETMTYSSWTYLKHAVPQLFELATTVGFYTTWYARAATVTYRTMSFWDVFAPLLIRYSVNMLTKMIAIVAMANASKPGGYTPVDEQQNSDMEAQKPKAIHALLVPLFYLPAVYTVSMLAAKLEHDVNGKTNGISPSLGVCMIFVFAICSLMVLFSCCGACFSPVEMSPADEAGDENEERGTQSQQHEEGASAVVPGTAATTPPSGPEPATGYQNMLD